MSITLKLVALVDKLQLQNFFMEKENKVMLNLSFDPSRIEDLIDSVLSTKGHSYKPSKFELDVLNELDR
jgi:NAD-specific glutamate dehydrogenase